MQRPRPPRLNERPRPRMGSFAVLRGDGDGTGADGGGEATDDRKESGVREANGDADKDGELKRRNQNQNRD